METPTFFNHNNYNLFGVLHEPESINEHAGTSTGIVFCSPFAEEKLLSHRVMVNLAREITKVGIYCFRFDYMGHGDSDGNFEDSTIETRLSDIQCAVNFFKNKTGVEEIALLGVRLGATLAVLSCSQIPEIDSLIAISPIIDGKKYIYQCLRSNLSTQMILHKKVIRDRDLLVKDILAGETVNIDGYLITKDIFEQIEAINILSNPTPSSSNVLFIQISNRKNKPLDKGLQTLFEKYKNDSNNVELLNIQRDLFWTENKMYNVHLEKLQGAIINWLNIEI